MKVYLSSTYRDLAHHRAVLLKALEKADHEVVAMEKYTARDARVDAACCGDVAACDVYVGIVAWRHGHVPARNNRARRSITEMEYDAAGEAHKPRLCFLLADEASWPAAKRDPDPARVTAFRERLKERCSGLFSSAHELASEVQAALRVLETTAAARRFEAVELTEPTRPLGTSVVSNLAAQLGLLSSVPFVELALGPVPWWNTRLYLVAAFAEDAGSVRGLVFSDAAGRHVAMAAPGEVRRRLRQRWPALEAAYAAFRHEAPTPEMMQALLWCYPQAVSKAFGADEQEVRQVLTAVDISYELGIARNAEIVDQAGKDQRFLQREILGRPSPYVALLRDGVLQGVSDRAALAERVAKAALAG